MYLLMHVNGLHLLVFCIWTQTLETSVFDGNLCMHTWTQVFRYANQDATWSVSILTSCSTQFTSVLFRRSVFRRLLFASDHVASSITNSRVVQRDVLWKFIQRGDNVMSIRLIYKRFLVFCLLHNSLKYRFVTIFKEKLFFFLEVSGKTPFLFCCSSKQNYVAIIYIQYENRI